MYLPAIGCRVRFCDHLVRFRRYGRTDLPQIAELLQMKNLILSLAIVTLLCSTVGCAGLCEWWSNKHNNNGCQPAMEPGYGFGYQQQQPCATGNCGQTGASYMNDGFIQNDPYTSGSNFGGATINPPVFDNYSNPSYGGTIVPPASNGIMPGPINN